MPALFANEELRRWYNPAVKELVCPIHGHCKVVGEIVVSGPRGECKIPKMRDEETAAVLRGLEESDAQELRCSAKTECGRALRLICRRGSTGAFDEFTPAPMRH